MVERTVYLGANLQVIMRLPTGGVIQASLANTGQTSSYPRGTPVAVHVPVDALRVLAAGAPDPALARPDDAPPEPAEALAGRP